MIETGTIIRGTLLESDLIPAFLNVLRAEAPARAAAVLDDHGPSFIKRASTPGALDYTTISDATRAEILLDDLIEELEAIAPEGLWFGAHEGDGSDFGYWAVEDDAP